MTDVEAATPILGGSSEPSCSVLLFDGECNLCNTTVEAETVFGAGAAFPTTAAQVDAGLSAVQALWPRRAEPPFLHFELLHNARQGGRG